MIRYLLLICLLPVLSLCAADVTTDEADYEAYKVAKEEAVKASAETAKISAETAQLTADLASLRKRFPSAKDNAEAFKLWREDLRKQPSNDERWNNYEWLKRVEAAAIKAGLTTDPLTAVSVETK